MRFVPSLRPEGPCVDCGLTSTWTCPVCVKLLCLECQETHICELEKAVIA